MEAHLAETGRDNGTRRNGLTQKGLKTKEVSFELTTPRNREGDFESP